MVYRSSPPANFVEEIAQVDEQEPENEPEPEHKGPTAIALYEYVHSVYYFMKHRDDLSRTIVATPQMKQARSLSVRETALWRLKRHQMIGGKVRRLMGV